ncbi:MAG: tRNA (adenosine(37)-N6)-threonylcarbamoyltransferase complex ATPase subunit type 1 TsaE [Kiloniellales bacterium]
MAAPQPCPPSITLELPDESATAALARRIAGLAAAGDVIALSGELGSGKTTFARAFINALPHPAGADSGAEPVPSPTFTLLQTYDRDPAPVWHFDLYRLERPEEVYEIGLEEALGGAISLIEWPERLGPLTPPVRLDVRLEFGNTPSARRAVLAGGGTWPARLERLGSHV